MAIKSNYMRAAEAEGQYQKSVYDALGFRDELKYGEARLEEDANITQSWKDAAAELLVTGQYAINALEDRKKTEQGVANLESITGKTLNFQKVSFLDVLSGKNEWENLWDKKYLFGGEEYTEPEIMAYSELSDKQKEQIKFKPSQWKYGQESLPVADSQREGLQLSAVGTEEIGYQVGGRIYGGSRFTGEQFEGLDLKGRGLGEWSSAGLVYEDYWKGQFATEEDRLLFEETADIILGDTAKRRTYTNLEDQLEDELGIDMKEMNITYAELKEFKANRDVLNDELSTEKQKIEATKRLNKIYRNFSDKVMWDEIAPYVKDREGIYDSNTNTWAVRKNKKELGFDLGPYQINTGWVLPNRLGGRWEKTDEGGNYKLYDMVNSYLDTVVDMEPPKTDNRFYGERPEFDPGDIFGEDTIFNKYRNQEQVNPFVGDEEAEQRKQDLMEQGIIDEYYNVFDANRTPS